MTLQHEAQPTLAGDITVTVCLAIITAASFYLGWQVFLALQEALS